MPEAWMAVRELQGRTLTIDARLQEISVAAKVSASNAPDPAQREQIIELKNSTQALQANFKSRMAVQDNAIEGLLSRHREWHQLSPTDTGWNPRTDAHTSADECREKSQKDSVQ